MAEERSTEMRKIVLVLAGFIFLSLGVAHGSAVKLPLYKLFYKNSNRKNLLLVGGVHGDENSGYLALYYLVKKIKIYHSNVNIYVLPFSNVNGKIYNRRNLKYDFNNKLGKRLHRNDIDYHYINQVKNVLERLKPRYVLSLHAGYSKTFGNKIVMDEKIYKGVQLYRFILPVYKNIRKEIKNIKLYISHSIKNRYSYNQDNFHDLSWYCLSRYHSYFYTIESTKQKNIINQIVFHLVVIKHFFKKLGIKSNIAQLIDRRKIKEFFTFKREYRAYLKKLRNSGLNNVVIDKLNIPIIIKHNTVFYYDLRKNKFVR